MATKHCDACNAPPIRDEVRGYIERVYPELDVTEALAEREPTLHKADVICEKLHGIYVDREKYSLHWAFGQASQTIIVRQEKLSRRLEQEIPNFRAILADAGDTVKHRVRRIASLFDMLSILVSVIDIVVSVALILVVTMVAGSIESMIESLVLNILFVGLIALAKVSLDRFFIIPQVEAWGWRRYHRAIDFMRQISVRLISVGIVMEDAVRRDADHDTLAGLFLRIFDDDTLVSRSHRRHLERLLSAR